MYLNKNHNSRTCVDVKYYTHYHWKIGMVPTNSSNQGKCPFDQFRYVSKRARLQNLLLRTWLCLVCSCKGINSLKFKLSLTNKNKTAFQHSKYEVSNNYFLIWFFCLENLSVLKRPEVAANCLHSVTFCHSNGCKIRCNISLSFNVNFKHLKHSILGRLYFLV